MPRVTLPRSGQLLSAEQTVRLTLLDSVTREQAIEAIASHLRGAARSMHRQRSSTPRDWYASGHWQR